MESLNDCSGTGSRNGRLYKAELKEPRSGMYLEVSSPRRVVIYRLDDPCYGNRNVRRPDGVLVVEEGSRFPATVCFVELKGHGDQFDHAVSQIESAAEHFCPDRSKEKHGTRHHSKWKTGEDMPVVRKRKRNLSSLQLTSNHDVAGAVITNRMGTRLPPKTIEKSGKKIRIASIQKHDRRYGSTRIDADELLSQIIKR